MTGEVPYGLTAAAAGATIAVSVALVTIAHRLGSGYPQAFRLMRGAVSLVLTLLGFFALFHWWDIAKDGYVTREVDPLAMVLAGIPMGHFAGDLLLMVFASVRGLDSTRKDLVAHHITGMLASALVLFYPIAAPLFLCMFTTEMMPMTTGIVSWAELAGNRLWVRRGMWARLATLVLWRTPFWSWSAYLVFSNLLAADCTPDQRVVFACSGAFLGVGFVLDSIWTRKCLKALRS
jgi:hypothetical protein